MENVIHTLVLHLYPDLEALCMAWLCRTFDTVRAQLGIVSDPQIKLIPSGALRPKDWEGLPLDIPALTREGYLFLDCGGGHFDQHMFPDQPQISSIDRLAKETRLLQREPYLTSFLRVISANDVRGTGIVKNKRHRERGRESVVPHLRSLISGWNLLYPGDAEKLYALVAHAFGGVMEHLLEIGFERLERGLSDREISVRGLDLFLLPSLREGVARFVRAKAAALHETHDILAVKEIEAWHTEADRALSAMEDEWHTAAKDFSRSGDVRRVGIQSGVVAIAFGVSGSMLFGAFVRHAVECDIVIQFRDGGKFTIASRSRSIEKAAQAIWRRELICRKMDFPPELEEVIACKRPAIGLPDHPTRLFYFFPTKTLFGNHFHSNPFMSPSALSQEEITYLLMRNV